MTITVTVDAPESPTSCLRAMSQLPGPRTPRPGQACCAVDDGEKPPVVSPDDCAPEKCWENCVNTSAPRPAFPREICERATQDGHHRNRPPCPDRGDLHRHDARDGWDGTAAIHDAVIAGDGVAGQGRPREAEPRPRSSRLAA